ncbi:hypothetical protein TARUN_4423 [Trichoderma arundinaceum]|uniref:Uncharacterized protein n=1 Tax=Trichoderma arundinaceum TaxID=490622 RepID=A0A395NNZ4_TRIAR|nr:hypothetical protein TARUN_4423 [Trichoderma arundinaceum]
MLETGRILAALAAYRSTWYDWTGLRKVPAPPAQQYMGTPAGTIARLMQREQHLDDAAWPPHTPLWLLRACTIARTWLIVCAEWNEGTTAALHKYGGDFAYFGVPPFRDFAHGSRLIRERELAGLHAALCSFQHCCRLRQPSLGGKEALSVVFPAIAGPVRGN